VQETANRQTYPRLVSGQQLLEAIFEDGSRPSPRWLRYQMSARAIPYVKVGRRVFFDVAEVRGVLSSRFTIRSRAEKRFKQQALAATGNIAAQDIRFSAEIQLDEAQ
jgi:hypothetical protein